MNIGERLKSIRLFKKMSQGDIEHRTGLLRCYISRVENGHTVPSVETLEKIARALDMKIYHILYEGDEPPPLPPSLSRRAARSLRAWGSFGKEGRYMRELTAILPSLRERQRDLLHCTLAKMVSSKTARKAN